VITEGTRNNGGTVGGGVFCAVRPKAIYLMSEVSMRPEAKNDSTGKGQQQFNQQPVVLSFNLISYVLVHITTLL
jgi:hypothetical protein